jgi:class 3 adenylate cyclase
MSATRNSTLADVRRSKADLQRENAELRRRLNERTQERDEALQRETATAEVLGVINSSPGDLTPVFDAILEKAHALCGVAFGSLQVYEAGKVRAVAVRAVAEDLAKLIAEPMEPRPGSAAARLIAGERFVQTTDVAELAKQLPDDPRIKLSAARGYRTALFVPLRKEGNFLGHISGFRTQVHPFSDKEIALLENFAAQAVIAMENAQLLIETREALEQQSATAEVLGVINASPGDLAPVFDAMLEKALRLCGAAFGYLQTYDGERFLPVAWRGLPPPFAEYMPRMDQPGPSTSYARILAGARFVHVTDLQEGDAYRTSPLRRALIELGGARTSMLIALRRNDTLLGTLVIYRQEVRPFSDKEIALLQNFAAQAVIAMENARLITETREALEQQTATAEVLGVINASPGDLAPVFDAILEKAHALCGVACGSLELYEGEHFRAVATIGFSDEFAEIVRRGYPGIQSPDTRALIEGERYSHILDLAETDSAITQRAVEVEGHRTLLCVPLRRDGQLLGMIASTRKEVRAFSDKEITLLENFAAQAVIAMENARLLGELRERNEEIAAWNRELEARVAAQLAELERTGKLRRFLAPQLADLIIAQGDESILESHRREIVVLFCDIRGFTAFAERAEPEEVMALLRDYHAALGPIVARFEGTLDHYSGDGVMVFFNDPLPTPEPAKRAIEMAVAMRDAAQQVLKVWRRHGHDLGFGVGISQGYATLGQIGFAERMDYTAIGTVSNLAARLCSEARDGQILISRRVAIAVEDRAKLEEIGEVELKGLSQAVAIYNVME